MKNIRVAFIGAGNMARSLIGGLITDGWDPKALSVADPDPGQLASLLEHFPVQTSGNNHEVIADCEVVLLAVKPQVMREVALDLAATIRKHKPLVVSIAAGIRADDLQRWLGGECALVRCMPNTPALVQSGATALYATENTNDNQRDIAESILRSVGLTIWLEDEDQMDAVTALSGSGPAYLFLVIEALQAAGEKLGIDSHTARLLALQTAFGAAKMALESTEGVDSLRQRVTSPGGTTEAALAVLEQCDLRELFNRALQTAHKRSRELAEQLGAH